MRRRSPSRSPFPGQDRFSQDNPALPPTPGSYFTDGTSPFARSALAGEDADDPALDAVGNQPRGSGRPAAPGDRGRAPLVVWRTGSGSLSVLDGTCRHLGASLGHVGRIVDDCVRCPFHGWAYDQDGVNVDQPGLTRTGRPHSTTALRSHGVVEIAGLVLVSTSATSAASSPEEDGQAELRADLTDALGIQASMRGTYVAGNAQRWVLRLPASTGPDHRTIVQWILAGRDGERSVPGTDPRWTVPHPGVRVERSRGPLSVLNGTHTSAPRVRFLRTTTDPVLEMQTVAGGIHVARLQPNPATLRPSPARRRDALLMSAFAGSRVVASVSALTPDEIVITAAGVYPGGGAAGRTTAAAGDLLLRTWIGRRLALLANAVDLDLLSRPDNRHVTPMNGVVSDDRTHDRLAP